MAALMFGCGQLLRCVHLRLNSSFLRCRIPDSCIANARVTAAA
jgi:hypothetical protein